MMDTSDTPSVRLNVVAASLQAEKRLMFAVLEGAVSDFQKYATALSGRGRRLFTEAEAWLGSTASDRVLDFENICHALELDPSFLRGGLRRWCIARQREPGASRSDPPLPFRRVSATRPTISAIW